MYVDVRVFAQNFLWHAFAFLHYLGAMRGRLSAEAMRVQIFQCMYVFVNNY